MRRLILAPLRGFTEAVFRNVFQRHFRGIDEAVAPFITPIKGRRIKPSHLRDLAPADNRAMPVVPQVLSNSPEDFIRLADTLFELGYGEVNWNLGCPYPMVAKKRRGSGLLPHAELIDRFLERTAAIFPGRVSVKTRLGRFSADEMDRLIPVFNRYPLARVIIHPRTGVQMYDGQVDVDRFAACLLAISHPVVFNGDINDVGIFQSLEARFPRVSGWMLGRGLMANPFLAESIGGRIGPAGEPSARFAAFHDELVDAYCRRFSGPGHVLDRMKGYWGFMADGFGDGRRLLKRIRKAGSLVRYREIVAAALDGPNRWDRRSGIPA